MALVILSGSDAVSPNFFSEMETCILRLYSEP